MNLGQDVSSVSPKAATPSTTMSNIRRLLTQATKPVLSVLTALNGGAGRDRTDDLKLAKLPLSQLSYSPLEKRDPPQLSLHSEAWWAWVDSNYRPHAYQACALTT